MWKKANWSVRALVSDDVKYNALCLYEKKLHMQIPQKEYAWTLNQQTQKSIQEPQGDIPFPGEL